MIPNHHNLDTDKPIYSISGVLMTNICDRDRLWCAWIDKYGASDKSTREFLKEYPPCDQSQPIEQI